MYEFTFVLLFFLFLINYQGKLRKSTTMKLLLIAVSLLIFQDGLRWRVGTDWSGYEVFFVNCNEPFFQDGGLDLAYVLLNKFIRYFFDDYAFFVFFHALFVYLTLFWFVRKYSPTPLLSIFVLYFSMLPYLGMNRQYLAVCICILSIPIILKRRFILFMLIILLAFFFHLSAMLFFIAYFVNREWNVRKYYILLALAVLIALTGVIRLIPSDIFYLLSLRMGEKSDILISQEIDVSMFNVLMGIIKRCIWIVPLLIMRNKYQTIPSFWLFFNMYFISILMYIVFNGTFLQFVVQRGLIYFNIFEIILIPFLFNSIKNKITRLLLILLISCLGFYQMERTFISYKQMTGYDIFRPYNAIYMDRNKIYDDGR